MYKWYWIYSCRRKGWTSQYGKDFIYDYTGDLSVEDGDDGLQLPAALHQQRVGWSLHPQGHSLHWRLGWEVVDVDM